MSLPQALRCLCLLLLIGLLSACGSARKAGDAASMDSGPVQAGHYRVVAGDTLSAIARRHGQSVSSLMRMNDIRNPNQIEVGQVLKVQGSTTARNTSQSPPRKPTATRTPAATSTASSPTPSQSIALAWPAQGARSRNSGPSPHGILITNNTGTTVRAAAAGKVIYAGNGLRGYGNLAIIQHQSEFLTIYAHNRALNVKEGQSVTQGQKIAEMGNTESSRVGLYFELRYRGKAIDASRYLPKP